MHDIMRVALYSRVSTDKQEAENQLVALREYCKRQGYEIVREYTDICSGGKAERKQFKQMFEDASKRKFDTLLFWSLDRLSREGVLQTLKYLETLSQYGTQYKSFTEQYLDSLGPFRDAVLAILACIARQEKVRISERTKAGLARAASRGRLPGRPKAIDEELRERIIRLRAAGVSYTNIAKKLGVSESSVRRSGI
ncbi:MAG: recombinase family protein [Acidobacteriaceae bacterium]